MSFGRKRDKEISLLVPFRADDEGRQRNWDWLRLYWSAALPEAEIVEGHDRKRNAPFSKTAAVNNAAKRAKGRFFVILDADAYLDPESIREAVRRMKRAERRGHRLWFVPYRRLWRLTEESTQFLLSTDPRELRVYFNPWDCEGTEGSLHGRRFGAMCQIMPREAFFAAGGMDTRFRGWGGEDVSFVRAVDTLWSKHKTTDFDIFHLHHNKIGHDWRDRAWKGQKDRRVNENLATQYDKANHSKEEMKDLVRGHSIAFRWMFWKRLK